MAEPRPAGRVAANGYVSVRSECYSLGTADPRVGRATGRGLDSLAIGVSYSTASLCMTLLLLALATEVCMVIA